MRFSVWLFLMCFRVTFCCLLYCESTKLGLTLESPYRAANVLEIHPIRCNFTVKGKPLELECKALIYATSALNKRVEPEELKRV